MAFKFDNGAFCYNGPSRSLVVSLPCGEEDEILEVDEPRTCEYTMKFTTPAACSTHHAIDLNGDLEDFA